jgi:hypothetical protein
VQSDLLTDEDNADAEIPLPDSTNQVQPADGEAEEVVDDEMLKEPGGSDPMYSSPYSSFLLPLLGPGSLSTKNSGSSNQSGAFVFVCMRACVGACVSIGVGVYVGANACVCVCVCW